RAGSGSTPALSVAVRAAPLLLRGPDGDLRARGQAEPVEDVLDVALDGVGREHQALGDLAVGRPLGDQGRHLALPRRERGRPGPGAPSPPPPARRRGPAPAPSPGPRPGRRPPRRRPAPAGRGAATRPTLAGRPATATSRWGPAARRPRRPAAAPVPAPPASRPG